MTALLDHLKDRLEEHKLFVGYLMAGAPDAKTWQAAALALAPSLDVLEVGLPFSDPLMDGPVIASAGQRAIEAGVGPLDALREVGEVDLPAPKVVMTYYNPIHRLGEEAFVDLCVKNQVAGLIVPDLPLEASKSLRETLARGAVAWIPLVAPTSSPARVEQLTATASGFVYAVSRLGVTGARDELAAGAAEVVGRCRASTDLPILVGIGVTTPEHAQVAAGAADGVVVGSALVRRVMDEGVEAAVSFATRVRSALNEL